MTVVAKHGVFRDPPKKPNTPMCTHDHLHILAIMHVDELVGGIPAVHTATACGQSCLLAKEIVERLPCCALQRNGVVYFGGYWQAL